MTKANAHQVAGFEPAWEELFNRFADGLATADDTHQLQTLLRESPAARRAYREFVALHASLQWDYAAVAHHNVPPGGNTAAGGQFRQWRSRWIAAVLAGVVITGAAAAIALQTMQPGADASADREAESAAAAEVAPAPLATVTSTRFVGPAEPTTDLAPGQPIEAGRLHITGGAVELMLRNGVEILLEGPGELELVGELEAFLHGGTAVVRMPKGTHGFRLMTPSTEVLDLGTEFAVRYGGDSTTDVQVYDGAVIATGRLGDGSTRFPKRLEAGEAARFSSQSSGDPLPLPYRKDRFVRRLTTDTGIEHAAGDRSPAVVAEQIRHFGRPQAEAIVVARAAGPVTIDGRLDEWALAPGVMASLDRDPAAAEWMDGRMMYDADNLYIAARVGDPHPLVSTIDPTLDAEDGWRGGAVQVRLSTDRSLGWPVNANAPNYYKFRGKEPTAEQKAAAANPRLSHLTMWFHAATATPCLTIAHGMLTTPRFNDEMVNPSGFQGVFTPAADGRGYVMEYAIPWRLLNCESDPPQSGDNLAAAWQVLFSDEGGRLWRTQIVEVRNPDEPWRIYSWERAATWGRAEYR